MITKELIQSRLGEYGIIVYLGDIKFDYSKDVLKNVYIQYLKGHRDDKHEFISNQIGMFKGTYLSRVFNPSLKGETPEHQLLYEIVSPINQLQPTELKDIEPYRLYGLISPEGDFYQCDYMGHKYLEPVLFDSGQFIHMFDEYALPDSNGWLKLTGATLTKCEFTFETNFEYKSYQGPKLELNFKITDKQIEFMKKYAKARSQETINFQFDDVSVNELDVYIKKYYDN